MHPKDLKIEDFTYDLPREKIAFNPVNPRDSSKLLIYKHGEISEDIYRNLAAHLDASTTLVFNDTKVIKSRIFFKKETGAEIEVFCLEPYGDFGSYEQDFQRQGSAQWKCLIGKAGKWKEKTLSKDLIIEGKTVTLTVEIVERLADAFIIEFRWTPEEVAFGEILDAAGVTPLPPYIKRKATEADAERYQTVYSAHDGSVAAPTAGLHFTNRVLEDLRAKGITELFTTLHVGAGTFKPVKSETMEGHIMHNEFMVITLEFLEQLKRQIENSFVISVGTTSTRTLESIYWMGNKVLNKPDIAFEDLMVTQWEPYEEKNKIHSASEAVQALIDWMERHHLHVLSIETGIIIAPGYEYKIIQGLITNFHQPQSTLLLLVSALIGEEWHRVYDYALSHDFRFLSYGDGSLLIP